MQNHLIDKSRSVLKMADCFFLRFAEYKLPHFICLQNLLFLVILTATLGKSWFGKLETKLYSRRNYITICQSHKIQIDGMFRGRLCCYPLDLQSHSAKSSKYVLLQDGFRRNLKIPTTLANLWISRCNFDMYCILS